LLTNIPTDRQTPVCLVTSLAEVTKLQLGLPDSELITEQNVLLQTFAMICLVADVHMIARYNCTLWQKIQYFKYFLFIVFMVFYGTVCASIIWGEKTRLTSPCSV